MQTSDWVAIAAVLISSGSLAISLRAHLHDKYRLRFDGFMLITMEGRQETFQLGLTVTNEGRRPIAITDVHFETDPARATKDIGPIRTPIHGGQPDAIHSVRLTENESHRFMSAALTRKKALELARVVDICIEDSMGRTYRVPVRNDAYDSD